MVPPAILKPSGRICFCCSVTCFSDQKQQNDVVACGVISGCCILLFNQLVKTSFLKDAKGSSKALKGIIE